MHRVGPSGFALGVAISLLLAGCADTSGGAGLETQSAPGQGGVRGLVISDELFPVAGAIVGIVDGPMADTDAGGRFELGGVAQGTHVLYVNATGYEAFNMSVEAPLEGFAEVTLTIKGIPGQSPYVTSLMKDGYAVCTWSYVYGAGPFPPFSGVPCPLGQPEGGMKVEVGPDWRAGVHEATWRTQDQFSLYSSQVSTGCRPPQGTNPGDDCPGITVGRSPLKLVARPEDHEYAKQYAVDGKQTWPHGNYTSYVGAVYVGLYRNEINQTAYPVCVQINRAAMLPDRLGCPFGVGFATGIRFTLYHTTFYLEEPVRLEEYSAVPDG